MKVIIAGSRSFDNYDILYYTIEQQRTTWDITEIVSGGALGADRLGEKFAIENNIQLTTFIPKWHRDDGSFNRAAGHIRNAEMAQYADACIVFWDGESPGTAGMIEQAKKHNLELLVVEYNK